ncbi:STAS domain-containing protein [Sorangium sp. KYC3313]|uniref:STAS domain-containing protein n=1 Tax=Sorangium sp. KYC3313 TaxID=3449740 RepID=UPI003F8BE09B
MAARVCCATRSGASRRSGTAAFEAWNEAASRRTSPAPRGDAAGDVERKRSLLSAIEREQASVVLIDVTGVPMVDTGVADHLLRAVRAAALLGAEVVLVGIAPTVAQIIVQLGVDLSGVTPRGDLQAARKSTKSRG